MKNIEIYLTKTAILEEVDIYTAYTGSKISAESDAFGRIATIKADEELLTKSYRRIFGVITDSMKEFLADSSLEDKGMRLSLSLSNAYDDTLTPSLKDDLLAFFAAEITADWFRFSLPERENEWRELAHGALNRMIKKLCHRKKPTRRTPFRF